MNSLLNISAEVSYFVTKLYQPLIDKLLVNTSIVSFSYALRELKSFLYVGEVDITCAPIFEENLEQVKELYCVLEYTEYLYNMSHPAESYALKEAMDILFPFPVQTITPKWQPASGNLTEDEIIKFNELKARVETNPNYLLLAQKMFEYTLLN